MLMQTRCAGCRTPGAAVCRTCRFALLGPRPAVVGETNAAVAFTGRARQVVLGMKYQNRRQVARHLGGLVVNAVIADGAHHGLDVVTWAPTASSRRHRRGFDQAEVIARTVARQLGLPCRRLLDRRSGTPAQTGRSRSERLDGPEFAVSPGADGRRVLVIDDVVTTGTTLGNAARALRDGGARQVVAYAVAATPRGVADRRSLVGVDTAA